jgi:hypothetical protein
MIQLSEKTLIGKGLHREVHQHPENSNQCIKVVVNGDDTETKREQYYYRFLTKRGVVWNSLPQFFGNVSTDKGQGAVFDLIQDSDGSVSKTLEYYLQTNVEEKLTQQIKDALRLLRQDLLQQNIITMTLHPKNMVIQKHNSGVSCFIVDNIGSSEFLPLSIRFHYFGRRKIERKWQRFITLLAKKYMFDVT